MPAAKTLSDPGFDVSVATVDRLGARLGRGTGANRDRTRKRHRPNSGGGGVSVASVHPDNPEGGSVRHRSAAGSVRHAIASGGSGVVISSQSGHRLGRLNVEQNRSLATTPVEKLLSLPFLQPREVKDTLHAYQLSKRGNVLRVMAEAVRWAGGARGLTVSAQASSLRRLPRTS
jgi:hypothetical protein